ncbi:phospholipid carrier-dependent glycosyltransferase [Candidatus Daviesbacteria bacterium]|nr:phospholipid carrier-dependent glycosyltransferase [Candidatus Daviesbacteria bacterium]
MSLKIKPTYLLITILVLALFLRLFRIDYPNKFIFDEVYHAFTAKEYLHGSKEAWEYWTTPPPGVAYEWTHPPLAKEIMASSMFTFRSEDGWAWRLPGALLGVLSIYLIYLIGMKLFNNQLISLLSSFIFSLDGLNFVQSRIGMNDIYFITFMLLSLLFFLNKKFFISAIFFGLSISSKWAAIYLIAMYAVLLFKDKQLIKLSFFVIVAPIIYLLTYIPFFLLGHTPLQFIEVQQQMWWYHTGLKATHDYTSAWWSWPINLKPVWYFVDYGENTIANIFASGNPALFWMGAASLLLTFWEAAKKRAGNLTIIVLGFLIFWLPWSISPRIMFLYHYAPSIPFLALSLGYQLSKALSDRQTKKLAIALVILIILSFIFIFPFLTAIHIPKQFVNLFFATNFTKNPF